MDLWIYGFMDGILGWIRDSIGLITEIKERRIAFRSSLLRKSSTEYIVQFLNR